MTQRSETRVDQNLAREFFDYDPETGVLTWRARDRKRFKSDRSQHTWNARFAGQPAGRVRPQNGYRDVGIFGRRYKAHRLAWLWMTGAWPANDTDHINHVRDDNRWCNLREATRAENMRNLSMPSNNTSGVVGVIWDRKCSKWRAEIRVAGQRFGLGFFADKDDAIAARKAAERLHGFHPNHGRVAA